MRLIALMLARNEEWCIEASLDAALRWCDGAAVLLDRCMDRTAEIVARVTDRHGKDVLVRSADEDSGNWQEMLLRDTNFKDGLAMGGTHFAIVDCDEILTHNYLPFVRGWFEGLEHGQVLDVPMVPVWDDLEYHRVGDPVWSTAWLTLGFRDKPDLGWPTDPNGYQHHSRAPMNAGARVRRGVRDEGGVMHFQFANQRRLLAKHVLYRMVDHLRWPDKRTIQENNRMYDMALKPTGRLEAVPMKWWGDYNVEDIDLLGEPYQEAEIRRLLIKHGPAAFEGLDLKGFGR